MKNKNRFGSIALKSFIVIAVLRKNAFCIFPKILRKSQKPFLKCQEFLLEFHSMLGKCGSTFRRIVMMLIGVMPVRGSVRFK